MKENRIECFRKMYEAATPEIRQFCDIIFGDITNDELEIVKAFNDMAVDVCGKHPGLKEKYLEDICMDYPAVGRLFGRIGFMMMQKQKSTIQ